MNRQAVGMMAVALSLAIGDAGHAAPPTPAAADKGPTLDLPLDMGQVETQSPRLLGVPSNDDMAREYPRLPYLMGLGGAARMTCTVLVDGRLDGCHVDSEEPAGLGFGTASVRTAVYFRASPAFREGKPAEGRITIPMRWLMPDIPAPAPDVLPPAPAASLVLARQIIALQEEASLTRAYWRPALDQASAGVVLADNAQAGQATLDALRQGLEDVIASEMERRAHEMASLESEPDLRATLAFLQSAAGRAFSAAQLQVHESVPKDIDRKVAIAARQHLCPNGDCPAISQPAMKNTR